jgi:hypothetical protein
MNTEQHGITWIHSHDAASLLGIGLPTIYSLISVTRRKGNGHFFKKDGRDTYINMEFVDMRINRSYHGLKPELENLYFEALEIYGNDYQIAKLITPIIGTKVQAVYMRLREFKFTTKKTASEMLAALDQIVKEHYVKTNQTSAQVPWR